jgi:acetyltransferase
MSIFHLDFLFKPKRIALFYDPDNATIGETLFKNLIFGKYNGTIYLISEREEVLWGIQSYPDIFSIPRELDLALFTTSPDKWIEDLERCKRKGIKAVSLYYPDFKSRVKDYENLLKKIRLYSYQNKIRILGPNTLGFIVPKLNLNASLFEGTLLKGNIGFISDSATLASGILDWAVDKNVGFSFFVSLGEKVDIDLEDMIDYLGYDPSTQAIVVYLEALESGRKFMRSARGFARSKPIIVLKGGSPREEVQACFSILDELITEDLLYSAAFKRAGLLEVKEVSDLFHLAENLGKQTRPKGPHLAIVTNSGGFTHLALKTLYQFKGKRAEFTSNTQEKLKNILGEAEKLIQNPVDLLSTADPVKYKEVLQVLLTADEVDGVLIIFAPQFFPSAKEVALSILSAYKSSPKKKPLLLCFVGAERVREAAKMLTEAGLPVYNTPEEAIKSFTYMHQYEQNIQLLFETPSTILEDFKPDKEKVSLVIEGAFDEGRLVLSFSETMEILKAYGIMIPAYEIISNQEELIIKARNLGFPLSLSLETQFSLSELHHAIESPYQGIFSEESLRLEYERLFERVKDLPHIKKSMIIQSYFSHGGISLILGTKRSKVFGNVILFGIGDAIAKLGLDYSIGLPPLNQILARRILEETSIYKLMKNMDYPCHLLEELLVKFSYLIVDFPEIEEIILNPIIYYQGNFYALRGKIFLGERIFKTYDKTEGIYCPQHLSICPYPGYLIFESTLQDGRKVTIRPIKPEDEPLLIDLFNSLSERSTLLRFQQLKRPVSKKDLIRFCHIDYDQELTLIALNKEEKPSQICGAAHLMKTYEGVAELSVEILDNFQGKGLGTLLCQKLLDFAKTNGYKKIWMEIRKENLPMIKLALKLGFSITSEEEGLIFVEKVISDLCKI